MNGVMIALALVPFFIQIYIPFVIGGCLLSQPAVEMYTMIRADARQERPVTYCNPALVAAAQARAESLANGGYFAHCDPSGICPNQVVRAAGCKLPDSYGDGNQVESLVAGTDSPRAAFDALARSAAHYPHLFGVGDFYRAQDAIGVAVVTVPGSRHGTYFVILIAPCQ